MSRSALNTAGNLAYAAKSIYKMIKAFLRGGWYAAALEALAILAAAYLRFTGGIACAGNFLFLSADVFVRL